MDSNNGSYHFRGNDTVSQLSFDWDGFSSWFGTFSFGFSDFHHKSGVFMFKTSRVSSSESSGEQFDHLFVGQSQQSINV